MKIKLKSYITGILLVFGILLVTPVGAVFAAGPFTCTWTGAGDGTSFSDATNWSGCNSAAPVPADNDILIFDNSSLSLDQNLTNDLTSLSVSSIVFQGTGANVFDISGNDFTSTGGITDNTSQATQEIIENNIAINGNQTATINTGNSIDLSGVLTGSGNLMVTGGGELDLDSSSPAYTGSLSTGNGDINLFVSGTPFTLGGNVTITNGGSLELSDSAGSGTVNLDFPLFVSGNGDGTNAAISLPQTTTGDILVLIKTITLGSNVQVSGISDATLEITGPLTGSFTISTLSINGQSPTLIINSSSNTSLTPNGTTAAVGTPDTGAGLTTAESGLVFLGTTITAAGIYIIYRRYNKTISLRHRA